jgi:hypothetical protein
MHEFGGLMKWQLTAETKMLEECCSKSDFSIINTG